MEERLRRTPPTFIDHHDLSLDEELRNFSAGSSYQERSLLLSSSSSQQTNNFSVILLLVIVILLLLHNGDRAQLLSSDIIASQLPWRPIESKYVPALDHQDLERITLLNQSISALRNRLYTLERKNDKSAAEHNALTERLHQHNVTLTIGKHALLQQWQQHQQKANEESIVFITSVETQLERLRSKVDEVVHMNQQRQLNQSVDIERTNTVMRLMKERVNAMEARVATVKDLESVRDVNAKNTVWRMDMMVNDAVQKVWKEEGELRLLDAMVKATAVYTQDTNGGTDSNKAVKDMDNDKDDKKLADAMLSTSLSPFHGVDFAAVRSGARVIHEMTSPTFVPKHLQFDRLMTNAVRPWLGESLTRVLVGCLPSVDLLGVSRMLGLDVGVGTPEDAISSDMSLGSCWPIKGSSGVLSIKLPQPIVLSHVTIEHLHWSQAIDLHSAPRAFSVYASNTSDSEGFRLMVEGEYRIDGGVGQPYSQTQIFAVQDGRGGNEDVPPVQYVALRVQSNHGHEEFTCMYRFKVHGQQQQQP